MSTIETHWELWTYDVWGNKHDGYDVNDRSCFNRDYVIACKVQTFNQGTAQEFTSATPSDYQIAKAFGTSCKLDTSNGDDVRITIERASDGYPIGEMLCTSHDSLSPIRAMAVGSAA